MSLDIAIEGFIDAKIKLALAERFQVGDRIGYTEDVEWARAALAMEVGRLKLRADDY